MVDIKYYIVKYNTYIMNNNNNITQITTLQDLKQSNEKHVCIKNVKDFDILDLHKFEHIQFEGFTVASDQSCTSENIKQLNKLSNIKKIELNRNTIFSNYHKFIFSILSVESIIINDMFGELEIHQLYEGLSNKIFSGKLSVYTDQPIDLSRLGKTRDLVYINFSNSYEEYAKEYDNDEDNEGLDEYTFDINDYLDYTKEDKDNKPKLSDYVEKTTKTKHLRSIKFYLSCDDREFDKLKNEIQKKFKDIDIKVSNYN